MPFVKQGRLIPEYTGVLFAFVMLKIQRIVFKGIFPLCSISLQYCLSCIGTYLRHGSIITDQEKGSISPVFIEIFPWDTLRH